MQVQIQNVVFRICWKFDIADYLFPRFLGSSRAGIPHHGGSEDLNSKFEFTKDANNHLQNIAWIWMCTASVQHNKIFGDVVVFDTTPLIGYLHSTWPLEYELDRTIMECLASLLACF
jgi:hypothetical protein